MKISPQRLKAPILCALAATSLFANAVPAYPRFPAIRGGSVVFTSEGDLWKVAETGGQAQRLTTHPATELNSAISHDGKWLAFSASYEGAIEAYVMPLSGGVPKRISFENGVVTVLGWSKQGDVLTTMQNSIGPSAHRVVAAINPLTLQRQVFPVADANEAVLDDSGQTLYFTRYGLHMTGDNAKQYRGGAYAQLWKYDLQGKSEAINLFPEEKSNNKRPMWWKGQLYFVSDRQGAYNIWTANADGKNSQALSKHVDWDVRNAALGDGKIVYQLGADLHILDIGSNKDQGINIDLLSDFDQQRNRQIKNPLEQLTEVELAGKEERLLFTARGHLTIAGTGVQRRIDIALPAGARGRSAVFSHDDKWVYAIVDATGENEIWRFPANGSGKAEALTHNGDVHRWQLVPSPDGKWLAHSDKRGRLWLLDLASKSNVVIDDAGKIGIDRHEEIVWSPDSKTIAVTRPNSRLQREQLGLYDVATRQWQFVTSDRYESRSPTFSPDGKWLYFLSARTFQATEPSPWGDRNMGPFFDKRSGIYALALQSANRFPFKADDELSKIENKVENKVNEKDADKSKEKTDDKSADKTSGKHAGDTKDDKKTDAATKILPAIQYTELADRLYQVPLASGNYRGLAVDDKRLYFMEQDGNEGNAVLKTLAITKTSPEPEVFANSVRQFDLSSDKKHVYYRSFAMNAPGDFLIVEAGAKQPSDVSKAKVKIDDWSFNSNPREEWQQMFVDAWRMHRDFLYDDKMRGVDWLKTRNKYAPLVDRVTDRTELNDILGMMVSEVSALHSQVAPGDIRKAAPDGQAASLGAVLTRTRDGYRIEHIYHSEPELPAGRSPLSQPDLDIKEGDVITGVNGKKTTDVRDISDLLLNQADKQVLLHIQRGQAAAKAVIVTPINIDKQNNLRYSDWEQARSDRVNTASQGKIGYLHLRAMGSRDIASFARDFYSNIDRDGLIIDVRRNNGGNIDSWIIEKLLRKAWAFWSSPNNQPATNMQQTFRGHLVVLIDELTYSDGETFAAGIKALKLAPLVGKRTAGAGVWLSDNNRLADNGMVRVAENGQFAMDGHWLIEGVGVIPDVEVDNLPHATFAGQDQQLEVALKMLNSQLKEQPVKALKPQAIPSLK
ncbi:S41 family peptidase [Undibacterium sp. Rencai35W]|uniref:S41 family peptidase n=1 Tax=Undibacterium sp. Rencai35W TaxID=3413046 RepID=UPI003BF42DDC